MIAATEPRTFRENARMLVVERRENRFRDSCITELPEVLRSGDLLVVNDAATLPASLISKALSGASVEIRLVNCIEGSDWKAVLMGEGNWRTPTELRDLPELLAVGDVLQISSEFSAQILEVDAASPRLVTLRFSKQGAAMWSGIYAFGRPVQYSYLKRDLRLWSVQTAYASRPWAVEMPSAGYPLNWRTLLNMKKSGIRLATLTHAAGLSTVGDEAVDRLLPFAEHFEIPSPTIKAIDAVRTAGGRVIAAGTTVARALEGSLIVHNGLAAGAGYTDLVLDRGFQPQIVDGILTGLHDPAQSHFRLLRAFADERLLRRAWRHATEAGYLCHEFGDACLIN